MAGGTDRLLLSRDIARRLSFNVRVLDLPGHGIISIDDALTGTQGVLTTPLDGIRACLQVSVGRHAALHLPDND